jgi:hypothetical protein
MPRTEKGVYVGREPHVKAWRLLAPCNTGGWRPVVSRDVKFVESTPGFAALNLSSSSAAVDLHSILDLVPEVDETPPAQDIAMETPAPVISKTTAVGGGVTSVDAAEDEVDAATDDPQSPGESSDAIPPASTRKSTRIRTAPDYFDPSAYGYVGASAYILTDEPQSLSEVMKRPDWELWERSMNEELTSLLEKGVYTWVELPADRKALPSRWVFELKRTEDGAVDKYKSRVVAKGFMQNEGVD